MMHNAPRVSPVSVIVAGLFLSVFGYLWFGVLFLELQMVSHGYTESDYAGNSPLWYIGGVIISLAIAAGLGMMVRLGGEGGFRGGVRAGLLAAVGFGIPLVAYPFVFSPGHEFPLFLAGVAHILIGWTLAAGIIGQLSTGRVVAQTRLAHG